MKKDYCVYKHTTPCGKVYIGITSQSPSRRWNKGHGYVGNDHFYRAIVKYGWDNIKHEILFDGLSKEEATAKEIELIAENKSNLFEYGYNMTNGGEGSRGVVVSLETRLKRSKSLKGRKCPMKGKKHSEETRRKMSDSAKGRIPANKGKHITDETKRKISEAFMGSKNPNYGKPSPYKKAVVCVETGIVYSSIGEAAKATDTHYPIISKVCNGRGKTAGGYHWRFV